MTRAMVILIAGVAMIVAYMVIGIEAMGLVGSIVTGMVFFMYGAIALYGVYRHAEDDRSWRSWWPPDVMASFAIPMLLVGGVLLARAADNMGIVNELLYWDTIPGAAYRIVMAAASIHFLMVLRGSGFRRG